MPNHDTKSGCFQPDHQIIPTPNVVATPAALLSRLSGEYPVIARCQPLKIGIHEALYQALPVASRTLVRKVLAFHCGSRRYLEALAAGGARYALDGTPAGQVTEAHRVAAALVLSRRAEKAAPGRRAGPQRAHGMAPPPTVTGAPAAGGEALPRTNVCLRPTLSLRRRP
jgi:sRNA-binding protein